MFDTIHTAEASAYAGEIAAASIVANTITKPELLSLAKAAVEAGEQSFHDAAEALGVAQELHGATQAEMARAISRSEAWVSLLLRWRRSGYTGKSPFGPTTKADRLKHAKDRAASGKAKACKPRNSSPNADQETYPHSAEQPREAPATTGEVETAGVSERAVEPNRTEDSVSVTERPKSAPESQKNPARVGKVRAASAAPQRQTVKPMKSGSTAPLSNKTLYGFDATVRELIGMIGKRETVRFTRTFVSADELARAGKFLTDLSNLKNSIAKPTSTVADGNAQLSPEQSAEDMKARFAGLEALDDVTA